MNRNQTVNLRPASTAKDHAVKPETVIAQGSPTMDTHSDVDIGARGTAAANQWVGKVVGEYEIVHLLGVGGNGQVFKAHHRSLDLPVALKILHRVDPDDEATVQRFRKEAVATARLNHPNLIRATDAGVLNGNPFLVTEFVDGIDLNDLLEQQKVLSVANVCQLGVAACEGLDFLAEMGVVHRDIKPSNLMVDTTGHVRILDLGLAATNDPCHSMTLEGQLMGTLDFISPEQALNPQDVSFHSDMYSLGCTLYFLLTGRAPFQDELYQSIPAKILAHVEVQPIPIDQIRKGVPRKVADLITAMMAKHSFDRPASFREVVNGLAKHASQSNLAEIVAGEHESMCQDEVRWDRSKKWTTKRIAKTAGQSQNVHWFTAVAFVLAFVLGWRFVVTGESPAMEALLADARNPGAASQHYPEFAYTKSHEEPPYWLQANGKAAWKVFAEQPHHKAWVFSTRTKRFGWVAGRATKEEAIREAREQALDEEATVYSVDGVVVWRPDRQTAVRKSAARP